mgnify:CR=1 FL=1
MIIGIDDNLNLVYEGSSTWGHALWPAPFLSPATIKSGAEPQLTPPRFDSLRTLPLTLFREDAFDPVSRIRRGRFYRTGNSQPMPWQVYPHPAMATEMGQSSSTTGTLPKSLFTFYSHALTTEFRNLGNQQLLVALGSEEGFTIWSVVGAEKTATGDELVTLKARQSIGALPRINYEAVPAAGREQLANVLDKLAEDIYRAGPESVVDCAREAATAALSIYMQDRGLVEPGLDLGDLLKRLRTASEEHMKRIAISAGEIVQRFHSRRKNAEQEKRLFRPIREQDAEFAVQCVGTILCELGWADWV